MVRYTRCRILAKGKKKMVVSWERYEKSRSVKRRYSDSAMSGTLRALLSIRCLATISGRDDQTRTGDSYVPNVVRYQLRYIPKIKLKEG